MTIFHLRLGFSLLILIGFILSVRILFIDYHCSILFVTFTANVGKTIFLKCELIIFLS